MSIESLEDGLLTNAIAGLGMQESDRRRAERTRARCHRAMSRYRREKPRAAHGAPRISARALGPVLIGAVSAAFLFDVVRRALQLWGF